MKTHIRSTFFRGWAGRSDVVVSSLGWGAQAHLLPVWPGRSPFPSMSYFLRLLPGPVLCELIL